MDIIDEEFDEDNLTHFAISGVLPQQINTTGENDDPLLEVIICDGISGGRRYKNDMPETLSLVRKLADGTEYRANYKQV